MPFLLQIFKAWNQTEQHHALKACANYLYRHIAVRTPKNVGLEIKQKRVNEWIN